MRVNLYVPDEEKDIYEEAKNLLKSEGKSISRFFMDCLKEYLKEKKGKANSVIIKKITIEPTDIVIQKTIETLLPKGFNIKLIPLPIEKEKNYKPIWVITSPSGKYVSMLDYKLRYYPKRLIELVRRLKETLIKNGISFITIVIFDENDIKANITRPRIEKVIIYDLKNMREYLIAREKPNLLFEKTRQLLEKLFSNNT